jgi:hypothetical protein
MAQSSPMPATIAPPERAKRLRKDTIKARSPLMDVSRIECQNTSYDRKSLQN